MDFNILLDDDSLLSKYSHNCLVVIDCFCLFAYLFIKTALSSVPQTSEPSWLRNLQC